MTPPIVWSIAGSDSGGGAGIQADLLTFAALGVHGCTVLTASTAQNSCAVDHIHYLPANHVKQQLVTLANDLPAQAIKLGMPGSIEAQQVISEFLAQFNGAIVCDPVCVASCNASLTSHAILEHLREVILPQVDLLTPNLNEAEQLLNGKLLTPTEMEAGARALHALGPGAILLKGGHVTTSDWAQDYYFDGKQGLWLQQQRIHSPHTHGSGCSLAAAIAAALAKGYSTLDSIVLAKAHVYQGIRLAQAIGQGPGPVRHHPWPCTAADFPWLSAQPLPRPPKLIFPDCGPQPLGLYPIVDNLVALQNVLHAGATCAQLRIKHAAQDSLASQIGQAVAIAKQYQARLFINDHWQLAIDCGAYGVHLGQEDLITADLAAITQAKLRLGISCHNLQELATAHAIAPSYIGVGPIFPTRSKALTHTSLGLATLAEWVAFSPYPIVAIGGIDLTNLVQVHACKVHGIAMLDAIARAPAATMRAALKALS